ncbi:RNA polymerase recycling motor HelD [Paenibacillus rigui]|uniref:Helicase n=1 Tax=Paenibacillus rigui TaxID=554312 RepID=A0A229URA0_9BACL|nr:RNA polymerase recycling motor HelD [Paenibacillus rigui]OXM85920.1 helicase [Paenibacillus rigui]
MSLTNKDWLEEKQRVQEVIGSIEQRIRQLEAETGEVKTEVVEIRKHFWDEVTVNLSTSEDMIETHFSLRQQAEVLSERERSYRQAAATLKKLRRLVRSPYFGRIDFREEGSGESSPEPIYLGITSFRDEEGDRFLVYDWRAPVSSLYYDYPPGPAKYETPGGEITGELLLKRQYVIRDGGIHWMFDTGITIGDELLQQVLSRNSDAQMKSIVATIQKEQNQIIRNDRSRLLIVQGAAGSGKTSAALQRVAYLLYKYRGHLTADQMVLFSPNPMFNSYVSTVLPELGEENMQQTTFQEYLERRLGKDFKVEDPFDQMEYVLTSEGQPGYNGRLQGIEYKSSDDFFRVLLAYKDRLEAEGMLFKPVKFRGNNIVSAAQLKEKFYEYDSSIRLTNRIVLLRDWLLKEVASFELTQRNEPWVEEEIELLEPEDYQRAYARVRKMQKDKEETFDDFEKEKELLAKVIVHERLKPVRKRLKQLKFVHVRALYRQLFTDSQLLAELMKGTGGTMPELWSDICEATIAKLEQSELSFEDATPYLFLLELVQGFQTNTSVRHVIVDEVQDYSPFQLEFLKRLFPRSRMTALGDLNQAIYAHGSALGELEPLTRLYGPDQTELIRLTRSYRSTKEIVEFTRGMVPGGDAIIPFNRAGAKPEVMAGAGREWLHEAIASRIEALRSDGCESVAIICKTAGESVEAFAALQNRVAGLRLVTKDTQGFEQGVVVIPAYLAKGVEFDAVLIYDGSKRRYSRESERKLFYTACTRAMHFLYVYSPDQDLSPFITEQKADTYVMMPGV